jgi:ABC-2 type transport system permease protein
MRNLGLLILNNLKVTFRKKGNIIVYIFLPLVGVLVSMIMYSTPNARTLRLGFTDHDSGMAALELKDKLAATEDFSVVDVGEDEINKKLLDFELDAVVVVPEGYTESILGGNAAAIEIVSLKGKEVTAGVEQLIYRHSASMSLLSAASGGDPAGFDRLLSQTRDNDIEFNVLSAEDRSADKAMTRTSLGFLIMFVMLGSGFTSMIVLKEKRDRTYHRVCSAPVSSKQYIFANTLTGLIICILQIVMIQLAMKFVFGIETGISDIHMFITLLMFALVAVGLGLLITAFSSSSYMAGTLSTLVLTPTCMLGGCYWDYELMPDFMQKIGYFTPQRWVMEAIRKMQDGGTLESITLNLLVLAAFALAFLLIAAFRQSRTENMQKFV